jgi:hypothetical protein
MANSVASVILLLGITGDIHVIASKDKVRKEFDPHNCEPEAIDAVKEYRSKPRDPTGRVCSL